MFFVGFLLVFLFFCNYAYKMSFIFKNMIGEKSISMKCNIVNNEDKKIYNYFVKYLNHDSLRPYCH